MRVTEWYDGRQKPVRVGVYERLLNNNYYYSYWNGKSWGWMSKYPRYAATVGGSRSHYQKQPWRGLTRSK